MKTKNIFRMLLVAAALLMGANNVKATETTVWKGKNADYYNGDIQLSYSDFTSKGLAIGQILRVYASDFANSWSININSGWSNSLGFGNWKGDSDGKTIRNTNTDAFDNTNGYFEMTIGEGFNKVQNEGFRLQCSGLYVTKITLYSGGSSSKTTPVLSFGEGAQETYNITFGDSFTGPTATCDISSLEITYESSNRNVADVATYTGEITINGAGQAIITAKTQASDEYNEASASYTINVAKVNYTLSYSASTASAVLGQSWTAPTLNNPSIIPVTYSSTNTEVATIDQNGNVTLLAAGQTTIKANYAGDNNHEAKEASYVLTVSTPQPTISFSQTSYTTTFGEAFTAPVPTVYPAGSSVIYTSSNQNVAIVHNNTVIPVGTGAKDASYGETTITATLADNSNISATYTLRVNAPTAPQGATSVGAIWLGQYGDQGNGGLQPQLSISQYFSARESGGQIRFYGKVGPLNDNSYWRVEIVDPSWSSPRLYEAQGNGLTNGYFAVDVNNVNLSGIDYIILNGTNITITAVQVVAPATQTYTATAASTSNGTVSLNPTSGLAEGDVVTITATPATDYEVGSVSVTYGTNGSITPSSIGNNQYTFSMPAANVTVTVTFNEIETANGELDNVDMGDYAYRTYVTPCAINFSRSVGVEAYCATSYDEQSVTFTQVTGTCNAGVPVLLKKKTGAEEFKLWKLTDEDATGNTPSTNYLVAGPATVHSANKYVLTVHSGVVVFAETNFQSATVDASHAYLYLHNTNAARGRLSIRLNGESTGISTIENDERALDGAIYNLRGQRVENPTKGLYIINGKKVVIK